MLGKTYGAFCIVQAIATTAPISYVAVVEKIGCTGSDVLGADLLRDLFEGEAHFTFVFGTLPIAGNGAAALARLEAPLFFLVCPDLPLADNAPGS